MAELIAFEWLLAALEFVIREYGLETVRTEIAGRPKLQELMRLVLGDSPAPSESDLDPYTISGGQILYNGKPHKRIGVNMRSAIKYTQEELQGQLGIHDGEKWISGARWANIDLVRFYAAHQDMTTDQVIVSTRNVLDEMHKRDIKAIVVLTDGAFSGFGVKDTPENRNSVGSDRDRYTWEFYKGGWKGAYKKHVEALTAALGNHPAVKMWEIGNELFAPSFPLTQQQADWMTNFFIEVSDVIRANTKRLIGTGNIAFWNILVNYAYENNGAQSRKIIRHKNINVCSWHSYLVSNQALGAEEDHLKIEMTLFGNEKGVAWIIGETATRWEDESDHWPKLMAAAAFPFVSDILLWNVWLIYNTKHWSDNDGYWYAGSLDRFQEKRFLNVVNGWAKSMNIEFKRWS